MMCHTILHCKILVHIDARFQLIHSYIHYFTTTLDNILHTVHKSSNQRVMLGTGMTLERSDFTTILTSKKQRTSIPIGVLCQFALMPLSASFIGRTFLLPYHDPQTLQHVGKHLFLGLVLVGCSPGGTASNLVSLIAGADVALSVLLTSCSTVLASIITPLLTKFIIGSTVPVSGLALCVACARVVLAPVTVGVMLNEYQPRLCKWVSTSRFVHICIVFIARQYKMQWTASFSIRVIS